MTISFVATSSAEIIKLKNGQTVEGKIIENTSDYTKIDCAGVVLTYYSQEIQSVENAAKSSKNDVPSLKDNASLTVQTSSPVSSEQPSTISLEINPMIELNFKTKDEIYALRKEYVLQYPQLQLLRSYSPSEALYGQIVDKKPWWGILGLSYYGPGQKSIEGAAEESRFLANPYLLVGVDAGFALVVGNKVLTPIPIYPQPLKLAWNTDKSAATVQYDVSTSLAQRRQYNAPAEREQMLTLIAYNARDFGFNYLFIDSEESKNILPCPATAGPVLIKQYIHCGGSCGYPGGCNNMSPDQPELNIKFSTLPAVVSIKLWKSKPSDMQMPADFVFVIEMF